MGLNREDLDRMWAELPVGVVYNDEVCVSLPAVMRLLAAERALADAIQKKLDTLIELATEFGPAGLNTGVIETWKRLKREREARVVRWAAPGARCALDEIYLGTLAARIESGEVEVQR